MACEIWPVCKGPIIAVVKISVQREQQSVLENYTPTMTISPDQSTPGLKFTLVSYLYSARSDLGFCVDIISCAPLWCLLGDFFICLRVYSYQYIICLRKLLSEIDEKYSLAILNLDIQPSLLVFWYTVVQVWNRLLFALVHQKYQRSVTISRSGLLHSKLVNTNFSISAHRICTISIELEYITTFHLNFTCSTDQSVDQA